MYRPPAARGTPSTFKLHDDDENTPPATGAAAAAKKEENLSKTALKNKKKREAAKKRKEEEEARGGGEEGGPDQAAKTANNSNGYQGAAGLLFDADKEKRIRKIMDKIKAIEQLKLLQATKRNQLSNFLYKFCAF